MQPYRGSGLDQKSMQLQAPRDPRSLFELFATYDPARGLDELLASLDVTGLEPRHIYHSILGRRPETLQATKRPEHYNPRDHMRGALISPEFQRKIIPLILNAYPEKQRLLFIHVPKCAGTDLRIGLSTRYPALDIGLAQPGHPVAQDRHRLSPGQHVDLHWHRDLSPVLRSGGNQHMPGPGRQPIGNIFRAGGVVED